MKVPIFLFHKIGEVRSKYWTSKASLFAQLQLLKSLGYETITMSEMLRGFSTLCPNPCVLTFDDSYQNFLDALPILDRFNFKATIFTATAFIGRTNRDWEHYDIVPVPHLTAENLIWLQALGHDIQPHTVHHKNFLRCTADEQMWELTNSKTQLEQLLKKSCDVHCYPGGGYDDAIKQRVAQAGYKMAVCCDQGVCDTDTMDRYAVKRLTNYSEIV